MGASFTHSSRGEWVLTNLGQEQYEDENGFPFPASKVDALAPYTHIADGFYDWTCGACGAEHHDRHFKFSGRVSACKKCDKMNLLVRTNCAELNELIGEKWESGERDQELNRLRGIKALNDAEIAKIRTQVYEEIRQAVNRGLAKAE